MSKGQSRLSHVNAHVLVLGYALFDVDTLRRPVPFELETKQDVGQMKMALVGLETHAFMCRSYHTIHDDACLMCSCQRPTTHFAVPARSPLTHFCMAVLHLNLIESIKILGVFTNKYPTRI